MSAENENPETEKGANPAAGSDTPAPPVKKSTALGSFRKAAGRVPGWAYALGAAAGLTAAIGIEIKTSYMQSKIFRRTAANTSITLVKGPQAAEIKPAQPATGPYDERLGYTQAGTFRERLLERGYALAAQALWTGSNLFGVQLFPIYNEKSQAGLHLADATGQDIYAARFPRQTYSSFEEIPPVLVKSLLFVEDKGVLTPTHNPAVNWSRVANALLGQGLRTIGLNGDRSGGSTLATQIEKFRHSPEGITGSPSEKLRQMLSASVRAYSQADTAEAGRKIVLDYLNSMPLSAYPKFGEVNGFGDGVSVWFGADFAETNRLMTQPEENLSDTELQKVALAYRQSLSMVMAVKKPTDYLLKSRSELEARVDHFLPLLAQEGVISPRLRDAALAARVTYPDPGRPLDLGPQRSKAVDALRVELMQLFGVNGLYDLDRLDLSAKTTVDGAVNDAVSQILRDLADPEKAKAAGITGYQLLNPALTGQVVYSFTLYEKVGDRNVLRVQTDNFNGPFNINEGSKLELGSTAKLRTLVSYLQAIADLHDRATNRNENLRLYRDPLSVWTANYLEAPDTDKTLNGILEAAMQRTYSANPGERFFTGGGLHTFNNFKREDNGRILTVREAFHNSINLPFNRMLRDVVTYTMSHKMQVDPDLLEDPESPDREEYLEKFAADEGKVFLGQFWKQQRGKSPEETASYLAGKTSRAPAKIATIYRSLFPQAGMEEFTAFMQKECGSCGPKTDMAKLYESYGADKFNLNDRGYIARPVHPLELWLASYRAQNPDAGWSEALEASAPARLEAYQWLFKDSKFVAQNRSIRIMLEEEAFVHIHKTWKDLGFPFERMTPSLASALGASGDTPAALAELSGILTNDGVRQPAIRIEDIRFGQNTPYEMHFERQTAAPVRVLPAELADLVHKEMQGVVEKGTARRAFNSVSLSDGRFLPVGIKTGTGDNRLETYAKGGGVTSSSAKSRTGTIVFSIDDRFYGSLVAAVLGPEADEFSFTSALPLQVFKNIAPALRPVLDRAYGGAPAKPVVQPAAKPPELTQ